jgi:hypothetical protein
MDKIDIMPHSEAEHATMVEMHNLYHSHEAEQLSSNGNRMRCRVCRMPLENTSKGIETISRKGNTTVYEDLVQMQGFSKGKADFDPTWFIGWFIRAREFNIVDAIMRYKGGELRNMVGDKALREVFLRWFNPVTAMKLGIKSQAYAKAAFIFASRVNADDETRKCASSDPEVALAYAVAIDKKTPHQVTRDGCCRYMDTAIQYASQIDKGFHIATLTKALESEAVSFKYLTEHFKAGQNPSLQDCVKQLWVRTAKQAFEYATIVGPEDDTRALVHLEKDPSMLLQYALKIDKGPRDDSRQVMIDIGKGDYIFRYANEVDKAGRDDTRKAALSSAQSAYDYARNVDKGPRDDTRSAACLEAHVALAYAQQVDKKPCDETRNASSYSAIRALEYGRTVDKKPHWVTRLGACGNAAAALAYAVDVDRGPHDFTRCAACDTSERALSYASRVEGPHDDTRRVACTNAGAAFEYASRVDRMPSNETRLACQTSEDWRDEYAKFEAHYYKGFVGELFANIPKSVQADEVNVKEVVQ